MMLTRGRSDDSGAGDAFTGETDVGKVVRSVPIEPVRPASLGSLGLPSAVTISQVPYH